MISVIADVCLHFARWICITVLSSQHDELVLHTRPEVSISPRSYLATHADLSAMKTVWKILLRSSVSTGSTVVSKEMLMPTHQVLRSSTRDADSSEWTALVPPRAPPLCVSERHRWWDQHTHPTPRFDRSTRQIPSRSI